MLRNQTRGARDGSVAYGVPFPTKEYTHNLFFNFAGNLIGLVVVFSLLIPLSTMLRALVLEKEDKIREEVPPRCNRHAATATLQPPRCNRHAANARGCS